MVRGRVIVSAITPILYLLSLHLYDPNCYVSIILAPWYHSSPLHFALNYAVMLILSCFVSDFDFTCLVVLGSYASIAVLRILGYVAIGLSDGVCALFTFTILKYARRSIEKVMGLAGIIILSIYGLVHFLGLAWGLTYYYTSKFYLGED